MNNTKNYLSTLFSNEEINTKRQAELDLSKFFCILGMCLCHLVEWTLF